jgi:hypothetical protein
MGARLVEQIFTALEAQTIVVLGAPGGWEMCTGG